MGAGWAAPAAAGAARPGPGSQVFVSFLELPPQGHPMMSASGEGAAARLSRGSSPPGSGAQPAAEGSERAASPRRG